MKNTIYLLVFVALLLGCDSTVAPDGEVKIRIKNSSEYNMDSVMVAYPKEEVFYGNISSGENTGYSTVSKAYRYAYIEAMIQGELNVLQPVDFVGESYLESGSYTYILSVYNPGNNQNQGEPRYNLILELRKD